MIIVIATFFPEEEEVCSQNLLPDIASVFFVLPKHPLSLRALAGDFLVRSISFRPQLKAQLYNCSRNSCLHPTLLLFQIKP